MAETTIGLDEGSTTSAGAVTDASGNKAAKSVVCYDNGSSVATNVSSAAPLPVTQSGVATAANQTTANSALSAIQTAVEILDNIVSGTEAQVDIVASLPAGTNNIGDVDVASLPGTVEADITAIKTAVQLIDNAISGTEMQVDVVTLPGTTEADITAIKTAVEILDNAIAGTEMQVDVVTSALPTGAATASNQSTSNTHLSAIKTAVELIDNAIAGTEMQVDVVASLPAGTNNIGDVDIDSIVSGKTVKRAAISASTSGNNTLVAAVASNKIKVLGIMLVAAGDVVVRLEDGAGGTALTGQMTLTSSSGFVLAAPSCPDMYWVETSINTLLNLELSAAVQVSGCLIYFEEA